MRPKEFYAETEIDLRLGVTATAINTAACRVVLDRGGAVGFDKLLLATGAEPIRLRCLAPSCRTSEPCAR